MDRAFVHQNIRQEVSVSQAEAFLAGLGEGDNPRKRTYFEQLDELF